MSARPMILSAALGLLLWACGGCVQLDSAVHNARHCSAIGPETCEEVEDPFDQLCASCEASYDFNRAYPWPPSLLQQGEPALRAISPELISQRAVETEDGLGTLDLYVITSHGEEEARRDVTLIIQHGNYAGIEHYIPRLQILHELGYRLVIWDYRGYGKSTPPETPTSDQFLADARQIRELVHSELATSPGQVVIYGMSLGAVPSVEMALHRAPCAMVLEVPFSSINSITRTNTATSLGGGFLTQGEYENTEKIKQYSAPLLVIAASEDTLFSSEEIELIYENAASADKEFLLVEGAEHGVGEGVPETLGLARYGLLLDDSIGRCR